MDEYAENLPEELAWAARDMATAHTDGARLVATISNAARQIVPTAEYVSVVVVTQGKIEQVAAADDLAGICDNLQCNLGEGPSLDAAAHHDSVLIDDISRERRWSQFTPAVAAAGVRALMCVPFDVDLRTTGTINMYSSATGAFSGCSREVELFTSHAGGAVAASREREHLREEIQSRDVIGQAKGMLMERYGIEADQAFDLLRTLSQDSDVTLTQIAQQVVAAGADQFNTSGNVAVES